MTLPDITPRNTGDRSMGGDTSGREYSSRDEIARLAYEFYNMRGRQEGRDIEDWLRAERELARLHHDYQEYG